ncbi:hypothetical protein [Gordonia sp. NB41Y]|uniref:hypothetical protein n=1 Tax=Gordonia sp. NB41Y TaxID=875808 RepID=UPI0006B199D1|nr:hypothetical protein [Gordonia sp. NB41Y]KOY48949.1 hypothetical protein ISGA_13430 [Gordonia sp. NB41Y]WLP91258.1 hypothetical protein Q9K23_03000 [Gordonia sp. NB41Y]
MTGPERFITVGGDGDRADALAFLARVSALDDAAVIRVAQRPDGLIGLWSNTGFDVLATRAVFGRMAPQDLVCDAAMLRSALSATDPGGVVDPGMPFDSAWRGALPLLTGFQQVDDVPARAVVGLARDGARLAREEGSAHGPATGVLDQEVLEVTSDDGRLRAGVIMRSLFALTAMGFIRDRDGHAITADAGADTIDADEPVRIRMSAAWIRIDARFGTVYQRRHRDLSVSVLPSS